MQLPSLPSPWLSHDLICPAQEPQEGSPIKTIVPRGAVRKLRLRERKYSLRIAQLMKGGCGTQTRASAPGFSGLSPLSHTLTTDLLSQGYSCLKAGAYGDNSRCVRGALTLCFPHKRNHLRAGMLPGLPEGGGDVGGAQETGILQLPEPRQEGQLSGLSVEPSLLPRSGWKELGHHFWPRRGGGGWDMAWPDAPHGGCTGKLHLTLTSAAPRPAPPPSPKRASGSLPGWVFIPLNREIGNEP